jgi:hypothetical protein
LPPVATRTASKLVTQLIQDQIGTQPLAAVQVDVHLQNDIDFAVQRLAGQLVEELVAQPAARLIAGFEQGDRVALAAQMERGGQARGPGADDRHALARVGAAGGDVGIARRQIAVGHDSFQATHLDRPVRTAAAAAFLARFGTHAAQHGGQRNVLLDRGDGAAEILIADLAQHQLDVHVRRAREEAGGQAIAHVIAEQQLQGRAPQRVDLGRLALDAHPVTGRHPARRHESAAIDQLDQAHLARRRGPVAFQIAQRRHIDSQPPGRIQHRRSRRHLDLAAVDGQLQHFALDHEFFLPVSFGRISGPCQRAGHST